MKEKLNESRKSQFEAALRTFLIEVNGLLESVPTVMDFLLEARNQKESEIKLFIENNLNPVQSDSEKQSIPQIILEGEKERKIYKITLENSYSFEKLMSERAHLSASMTISPKGFLVTVVSQFDAFMGRLIKAIYNEKPDLLNASERKLTFENLIDFGSIEAAREFIIEKEVESILRQSHAEHFNRLEKMLGIPLTKELSIWPEFIEITERRNLFVHTDGVISSQYIHVCSEHKVFLDENICVGKRLGVRKEYFQRACEVLFELATKLTYVIWRRQRPFDLEKADRSLNNICFKLLIDEKYELAKEILAFAISFKKPSSELNRLIFVVNQAIAWKWGGEPEKATKLIETTDWSACSDALRLAKTVLMDDFNEAADLMIKMGSDGEVSKVDYREWPVFRDFRHSSEFETAYRSVFGEMTETLKIADNDSDLETLDEQCKDEKDIQNFFDN